jgi:adenylosuccinate lyase
MGWLSVEKGLSRVALEEQALNRDLANHPEVLAEAIQTIMRADGLEVPYEKLKDLTRGKHVTLQELQAGAQQLAPNRAWQDLAPETYVGLAPQLAREAADLAEAAAQALEG